jgi:cytochrome P450
LRLSSSSFGVRVATARCELPLRATHPNGPARLAVLQPGTRVFLATTHHGEESSFPDAAQFRPGRFLPGGGATEADVLAFGGGVSKCPGRLFALAELRLLLLVMLSQWQIELLAPLPPLHAQRAGLGVLPPLRDVPARLRRLVA